MTDFEALLRSLAGTHARFVLVGGFAGTEIAGGGRYEELVAASTVLRVFDVNVRVVTLPQLIHLKRAAGRPKDLEAIAELELLLAEHERNDAP